MLILCTVISLKAKRSVCVLHSATQPEAAQTSCNLVFEHFLQLAETTCIKLVVDKKIDNQLASSLLTTCSRFVIIKPEQAMRTGPDIGLMTANLQQTC